MEVNLGNKCPTLVGGYACAWGRGFMGTPALSQSCPTLFNPMNCSLPGSSVHGILQARILEWVATSFFRGSSKPRDRTQVFCIAGIFFTLWTIREALSTQFCCKPKIVLQKKKNKKTVYKKKKKKKKGQAQNVQGGAGVWSGELIVAEPGTRMEIRPSISDVITLVSLRWEQFLPSDGVGARLEKT